MFSDGLEIRKYGSRLMVTEHEKPESEAEIVLEWNGESEIDLPQYNGKLVFTPAEEGFNEGLPESAAALDSPAFGRRKNQDSQIPAPQGPQNALSGSRDS